MELTLVTHEWQHQQTGQQIAHVLHVSSVWSVWSQESDFPLLLLRVDRQTTLENSLSSTLPALSQIEPDKAGGKLLWL